MNENYLHLIGLTRKGDVIGKTDHELFADVSSREQIEGYIKHDRDALALPRGETLTVEEETLDEDGGVRIYSSTKFPVFDDRNSLIGVATLAHDITKWKGVQREKDFYLSTINAVLETIPGTIVVVDTEFSILFISGADIRKRYSRQEIPVGSPVGEKCYEVFHEQSAPCPWCKIQKVIREDKPIVEITDETDPRSRYSEMRWKVFIRPVKNRHGEIIGAVEYEVDVTDIEKARAAAEAADRAKSEFIANISHEFRTPLNGVFGMLQLLETTDIDEEQREYLETAVASGNGLFTILNDILELSKVETAGVSPIEGQFDPEKLICNTAEIFKHPAEAKRLVLTCSVEENIPAVLLGDEVRIRQILFNLLGNAVKFTNSGSITVTASTSKGASIAGAAAPTDTDQGPELRFICSVADTGIGIPEDQRKKIFEPFTQVDSTVRRKYQGTGLGLHIVKRFVDFLGGEVSLTSREGEGTTVTVSIPVRDIRLYHSK